MEDLKVHCRGCKAILSDYKPNSPPAQGTRIKKEYFDEGFIPVPGTPAHEWTCWCCGINIKLEAKDVRPADHDSVQKPHG